MLVCKLFSIWWEGEGRTSSKMFRMQFLSCRGTRRRIRPYSVCVVVGREKRCTLSGRELALIGVMRIDKNLILYFSYIFFLTFKVNYDKSFANHSPSPLMTIGISFSLITIGISFLGA